MIKLIHSPIDVEAMTAAVRTDQDGAVVSFIGVVRNHHQGRRVIRLEYHAYEPMAQRLLEEIGREVEEQWPVRIALEHRLGCLKIGEASVAIVVASPHRAEAFDACRHAIERIKADVPIWKKEHFEDGPAWIEQEQIGGVKWQDEET